MPDPSLRFRSVARTRCPCKTLLIVFACLTPFQRILAETTEPAPEVTIQAGELTIPTYSFETAADTAPLFESGNAKGLYPYTAFDRTSLGAKPEPVTYQSITVENRYLRVVILPELGGRIWSAWDKQARRNLFYTDQVIKPSAYNQRGAWPVGNLEVYGPYDAHMLTWPGEPWPWTSRTNPDGSATVILSHIDPFFRDKLFMEVTLRPGRRFIEFTLRLHNSNLLPNRYLLWTNAGIPATEGTRFVYPMTKTIGHDTADYGSWPVFRGTDLSWYRNNPAMLGVFGLDVYDNFLGAYDYSADQGTVCVKDRRIARGIKTWTWGTGVTGRRHMESYTDSGQPYIEVQSGRFVWDGNYEFLEPGQSDGWTEYWYGTGDLGGLTTATRDIAARINISGGRVDLSISPTGDFPEALLSVASDETGELVRKSLALAAGRPFRLEIPLEDIGETGTLRIKVLSGEVVLLDHVSRLDGQPPEGEFASDAIPRNFGPSDGLTIEELVLKGLTEEKLGRTTRAAATYREALQRDPLLVAPNLRLGLLALSRFQDGEAFQYFSRALERDPSDSEIHYLLGVTLYRLGRFEEAQGHFFRLVPSSGKFNQRDYCLGLLALLKNDTADATRLFQAAAERLPRQSSVFRALSYSLRLRSDRDGAQAALTQLRSLDPTSAFSAAETGFWTSWPPPQLQELDRMVAAHPQGYLELASEYLLLGAWAEAEFISARGIRAAADRGQAPYPMLAYYQAYALDLLGRTEDARQLLSAASSSDPRLDFYPYRFESIQVLRTALSLNSRDSNAAALLGDLLYSRDRREEALTFWEAATAWNPRHFSSLRNLGWALLDEGDRDRALLFLERAVQARPDHLETGTALAHLYMKQGKSNRAISVVERMGDRLQSMDQVVELGAQIRAVGGDVDGSLQLLERHEFAIRHQSYGLLRLYQGVRFLKSLERFRADDTEGALLHLNAAAHAPANLGIDDFAALESSRIEVFKALLLAESGQAGKAKRAWQAAAATADQDSDGEGLFRAIALSHLGEHGAAEDWLREFERLNPARQGDSDPGVRSQSVYLAGLYAVFRGDRSNGRRLFTAALDADASDLMARHALDALDSGFLEMLEPGTAAPPVH